VYIHQYSPSAKQTIIEKVEIFAAWSFEITDLEVKTGFLSKWLELKDNKLDKAPDFSLSGEISRPNVRIFSAANQDVTNGFTLGRPKEEF
jgi:hypothetical protein